jgi:hypothetical protein
MCVSTEASVSLVAKITSVIATLARIRLQDPFVSTRQRPRAMLQAGTFASTVEPATAKPASVPALTEDRKFVLGDFVDIAWMDI